MLNSGAQAILTSALHTSFYTPAQRSAPAVARLGRRVGANDAALDPVNLPVCQQDQGESSAASRTTRGAAHDRSAHPAAAPPHQHRGRPRSASKGPLNQQREKRCPRQGTEREFLHERSADLGRPAKRQWMTQSRAPTH